MPDRYRASLSWMAIIGLLCLPAAPACAQSAKAAKAGAETPRDGQHDFDFEIGTWHTHLKRLMHPLSGSDNMGGIRGRDHRAQGLERPRQSGRARRPTARTAISRA